MHVVGASEKRGERNLVGNVGSARDGRGMGGGGGVGRRGRGIVDSEGENVLDYLSKYLLLR